MLDLIGPNSLQGLQLKKEALTDGAVHVVGAVLAEILNADRSCEPSKHWIIYQVRP